MIRNAVLALFASPFLLSNAPESEPIYAAIPQIKKIVCGTVSGTAWRNGTGSYVTARHVTHGRNCAIDGEPAQVTWESAEMDLATIRTMVHGEPLKVNCDGFQDQQAYAGVGYARGSPLQRVIFVMFSEGVATVLPRWSRLTTLFGDRFIPGMSGGAVFGSDGRVVGIVNGYSGAAPLSYSMALKGTPLCA